MRAIVTTAAGGPEVLQLQGRPTPRPGPGEVLVDVHAAGVNFFDTFLRRTAAAEVLGAEGAGVVVEVGEGVSDVEAGNRVGWLTIQTHSSYAEQAVLPVDKLVPLPTGIDDETAAAVILQGLTAQHFTTVSHVVQPGDIAVVHAAAGGVGMMLTQFIKARGGNVIGLVSRQEKVELAASAGADHVLVSTGRAFAEPVMELTGGQGVHVVYDGAGATTFAASLRVLRTHGTLVFYGPLIDSVPTIAMNEIPRSTRITYGVTEDHVKTVEELRARTAELFALVEAGALVVQIGRRYPLADAAQAHRDIESRSTTGKLLLIP